MTNSEKDRLMAQYGATTLNAEQKVAEQNAKFVNYMFDFIKRGTTNGNVKK